MKRSALVIILLSVGSLLFAQDSEKIISVRPADPEPLDLRISGLDEPFLINEPIHFHVQGNHDFYLYVFTVDKKRGRTVLLLPNQYDQDNFFGAGITHAMPENADLRADRSGKERLLFIASKKKLNIDTSRFKRVGKFLEGDFDDMDRQVKAIRVRPKVERPFIRDIPVKIKRAYYRASEHTTDPPTTNQGCFESRVFPFLSTDQTRYAEDDPVRITFGANRSGYVYLYYLEKNQNPRYLKECRVNEDQVYRISASAKQSQGSQGILAVYSKNAVSAREVLDLPPVNYRASFYQDKSFPMPNQSRARPFAYYPFEVH
jgi:hypothetical protein